MTIEIGNVGGLAVAVTVFLEVRRTGHQGGDGRAILEIGAVIGIGLGGTINDQGCSTGCDDGSEASMLIVLVAGNDKPTGLESDITLVGSCAATCRSILS